MSCERRTYGNQKNRCEQIQNNYCKSQYKNVEKVENKNVGLI